MRSRKNRFKPNLNQTPSIDNQGFALPLILGMGLLMIIISTTLIVKSQGDQVTATAQKDTAESLALAEGGSSRTLGSLNSNYQSFLLLDYDPNNLLPPNTAIPPCPDGTPGKWKCPPNPPPCFDAAQLTDVLLNGKIPASAANNTYTVEAYRFTPTDTSNPNAGGIGTLLVKGYPPNSTAFSRIQQTFNVSPNTSSDPANFPGLYGDSVNLGNNDVLGAVGGNVFCKNCTVPNTQCVSGQPTTDGLRAAIGALNNGVVQGQIRIGTITLPPVPTAPTTGSIALGNFDGNGVTFPRTGDTPTSTDSNGVPTYNYTLSGLTTSGNNTMTVNTTNARIRFFVSGNISMSGNSKIANTCSTCGTTYGASNTGNPARFAIYGIPDNGGTYDQTFTLNGGATPSNLFVYAPDARMGINGGSSNPDIFGAIWVKEWNGSSSNVAEISVPNNMKALLDSEGFNSANLVSVYRTSATTNWQRRSQ